MGGTGFALKPAAQRRTRHKPQRGGWQAAPGVGVAARPIPTPPDGLSDEARATWQTWFTTWVAAQWTPGDVPGLRVAIRPHDAVLGGRCSRTGELRLWQDT